jgi:hypothetical protein
VTETVPAWALEGLDPQQYAVRVEVYTDGEDLELTDDELFDLSEKFGGDRTLSACAAGPVPWFEVMVNGTLHESIAQIPDVLGVIRQWRSDARILGVAVTPVCMTRRELAEFFAGLEGCGVSAELIHQELERLEPGEPIPTSFAYLLDRPAAEPRG